PSEPKGKESSKFETTKLKRTNATTLVAKARVEAEPLLFEVFSIPEIDNKLVVLTPEVGDREGKRFQTDPTAESAPKRGTESRGEKMEI
ncbi:hypothetical protein Ancab_020238, partial [Ancistrocladus abbreviatus]